MKSRVVAKVRRHLRNALLDRVGGNGLPLLKDDYPIAGQVKPHWFDLAIANGRPLYLADVVSFQGPSDRDVGRAIDAAAYAVEDVRRSTAFAALPVAVVVARRVGDDPALYSAAERPFTDAGAVVVPDDQLAAWADRVAVGVASATAN